MAVSIDARVGQREIDAAREAGADIEGVTSMQGTPVADVEEQITFGGYPNQSAAYSGMGPSFLSRKGLLNQEPSHVDVIDIINSLHPDFVANASPQELDYAISVVQGKAKYEEGVLSGPPTMTSRQPPWAGSRTQTTGTGATKKEATAKEIEKYNKAIKKTEESQAKISKINKELEQQLKNMERWYTSPARSEALLGPPLPQVAGPTVYSGTPTVVEDESAWGAGGYAPISPFALDRPIDSDYPNLTFEQWQDLVENKALVTSFDPKEKTKLLTVNDIKRIYSKTAKQHSKDKYNIQKKLIEDARKNKKDVARLKKAAKGTGWFSVESKEYYKANKAYNTAVTHDAYLKAYDAVIGVNPALKFGANLIGSGIGTLGKGLEDFFSKKGMYGKTSWSDIKNEVEESRKTGEPFNKKGEVAPTNPRETVSGGFWGLMSFAKQNKKLFKSLSGDELWALVSDPDEFWRFYEDALNAQ